MYQVFRNKRVLFGGNYFYSYEHARARLRSYIRQMVKKGKLLMGDFDGCVKWDAVSRNPVAFKEAGFQIHRVA